MDNHHSLQENHAVKRALIQSPEATTTSNTATTTISNNPKRQRHRRKEPRGSVSIVPWSHIQALHRSTVSSTSITKNENKDPSVSFVRSVPHKRGHWSGHVYIPISSSWAVTKQQQHSSSKLLHRLVQSSVLRFQKLLEQNGYSGIMAQHDTLHVSLSKYFSLPLACIDSFVPTLKERLQKEEYFWRNKKLTVPTDPSLLQQQQIEGILVNEEQTRSFWVWNNIVQPNTDTWNCLLRLVHHVNEVLVKYNQPSYYDPPLFHISLASFPL